MDREKIITIVIGLAVGALLAGTYFFGPKVLSLLTKKQGASLTVPTATKTPPPTTISAPTLSLTKPDDNSETAQDSVTVSGKGDPNLTVVIFANADQKIATPDAQGNFSISVKLEPGENEITVSQINAANKIMTIKRNITEEISK